jgi:urease accessory protein
MTASLPGLLAVLQLASPTLPVGGFAYSQGLEAAAADGTVHDAASAGRWIEDALTLSLARLEAPLWLRACAACEGGDAAALRHWNAEILAARETAELRAESLQMGASLLRVLPALGLPAPPVAPLAYASAFAWACAATGVPREEGLAVYLWTWAENQVLAALKSLPIGQQAGQALLVRLRPAIAQAVATAAALDDADIGSCALGLTLASQRHETQYSRLFRS